MKVILFGSAMLAAAGEALALSTHAAMHQHQGTLDALTAGHDYAMADTMLA